MLTRVGAGAGFQTGPVSNQRRIDSPSRSSRQTQGPHHLAVHSGVLAVGATAVGSAIMTSEGIEETRKVLETI